MKHNQEFKQRFRRFFGLPKVSCVNLDFEGHGCVSACLPCLLESDGWLRGLAGCKTIAEAQK